MSDQPSRPGGGEPDLRSSMPIIGTSKLQGAVDGISKGADKVAAMLDKFQSSLNRLSAGFNNTGMGTAATLNGGKANGGGSTIGGAPMLGAGRSNGGVSTFLGMPQHEHNQTWTESTGYVDPKKRPQPAATQTSLPNGGGSGGMSLSSRLGMAYGAATVGSALAGASSMVSSNTTAQLMNRGLGGTGDWASIRSGYARGNYTATSDTDAAAGAVTLMGSGYAVGSRGMNTLLGQAKSYGALDPTVSSAQATARMQSFSQVGNSNFLLGRGIGLLNSDGSQRNQADIAAQITSKSGLANRKLTKDQLATEWGTAGYSTNFVNQLAQTDPNMAARVKDQLQAEQQGMLQGKTKSQIDAVIAKPNGYSELNKMLGTTDLGTSKELAASKRDITDTTAYGFSKGLDAAASSLEKFNSVLTSLLDSTHAGSALGGLGGIAATSAIGGAIGHIGASMLGMKAGGSLLGRAGGALKSLGSGAKNLLGRGAGAVGDAASSAGRGVAGAASRFGGGALDLLGKWGGPIALGVAGVQAIGSHTEVQGRYNALRAKYIKDGNADPGGHDFGGYAGAYVDTMANRLSFGLSDKGPFGDSTARWKEYTDGIGGGALADGGGTSVGSTSLTSGAKGAPANAGPGAPSAAAIIAYAKTFLGVPYVWGGTTPKGFDCSGFLGYVFRHFGINLPRTSGAQEKMGSAVKMTDLQPGDLVFVSPNIHVAMYIGGGKIIEAPHTGANVQIVGLYSKFNMARRILGAGSQAGAGPIDASANSQSVSSAGGPGATMNDPGMSGSGGQGNVWGISEASIVEGALGAINSFTNALGVSKGSSSGATSNGASAASAGGAGAGSGSGGTYSGSHSDWLKSALGILHLDYGKYSGALSTIIEHESSWNPKAVNLTDSNAKAGHPSKGLMQTIDSTFNAYSLAGHKDIWNPVDNIIAATRYAMSRYGSMDNVPGIKSLNNGGAYKGYDVGSMNIDVDQIAKVHKGEMILDPVTSDQLRQSLQSNSSTAGLLGGKRGGGGVTIQNLTLQTSQPFVDSAASDLAKQFAEMVASNTSLESIRNGG